jgi:RNA polymerase sigma-70 factor (ECF subfamily)
MEDQPRGNVEGDTDESLMRQFQSGDGVAFEILFDRYSTHLINFAHRFLFSREESEDAAQEVLLRIHGARDRYDSSRPFRPWLFSIASRLISNRLRQKKRHPLVSLFHSADEGSDESIPLDVPDRGDSGPEQIIEKHHLAAHIQSVLSRLPGNQHTAVVLARFEEMSNEEIAQTMGISVSSVKSLLFRARQTSKKRSETIYSKSSRSPKNYRNFLKPAVYRGVKERNHEL